MKNRNRKLIAIVLTVLLMVNTMWTGIPLVSGITASAAEADVSAADIVSEQVLQSEDVSPSEAPIKSVPDGAELATSGEINATNITLDASQLILNVGETHTLTASVLPANHTDDVIVEWTSSRSDVVSVTDEGVVTAIAVVNRGGIFYYTANVSAILKDSSGSEIARATCQVAVTQPATGVEITNDEEMTVPFGQAATIYTALIPSNCNEGVSYRWTSEGVNAHISGDDIAAVTASAPGDVTVTVSIYRNNNFVSSDSCVIHFFQPATGFSITPDEDVTLELGGVLQPVTQVLPVNHNDTTHFEWSHLDSGHAGVTEVIELGSDGKITAVGPGYSIVTVKLFDKNSALIETKSFRVDVVQYAESIEMNTEQLFVEYGDTNAFLGVTILPVTNNDASCFVRWSSSDTSVVTVEGSLDNNGATCRLATAGPGDALVTATLMRGNDALSTATCNVHVHRAAETLEGNVTEKTLRVSEQFRLSAEVLPADNNDTTKIVWVSDDASVVSVSDDGELTANKAGVTAVHANLYVKARTGNDWSLVDTCDFAITVLQPPTSFVLDKTATTMYIGDSVTVNYTLLPADYNDTYSVAWSASNGNISISETEVGNYCKVTALNPGEVTLTATLTNYFGSSTQQTCTINVIKPATELQLSDTELTVFLGESADLTATVLPLDHTDTVEVVWLSSDASLSVSGGHITAAEAGQFTVTAKLMRGNTTIDTKTCAVNVLKPAVEVELNKPSTKINIGMTETLIATALPLDHSDNIRFVWESSAPAVASVTSDGVVSAIAPGNAAITVSMYRGDLLIDGASCNVKSIRLAEGISISKTETAIWLGKSETITAEITPADCNEDISIVWSSDDTDIACVENGVIAAVGEGETVIRASISRGGSVVASASCAVDIKDAPFNLEDGPLALNAEETYQLEMVTLPYRVSEDDIVWTSGDEAVCTVDENGFVTAIGKGTTSITAAVGARSDSIDVTVTCYMKDFSLNYTEYFLNFKGKVALKPTPTPLNCDGNTYTWSSSNKKVATVSSSGVVTAKSVIGETTITAKSANGIIKTCVVMVMDTPKSFKAKSVSFQSIKLTWKKVSNATGYVLYRSTDPNGPFTAIKTITKKTTVSYKNSGLTTGTTYYYKIRAYKTVSGKKIYGPLSSTKKAVPTMPRPESFKAKKVNKSTIKLSWKAVSGATGYRIYCATRRSGPYFLYDTVGSNVLKYVADGLTLRSYYFKVCAVRKVADDTYVNGKLTTHRFNKLR